jgi:uncharacterized cupredoxin-like copper-binding protein
MKTIFFYVLMLTSVSFAQLIGPKLTLQQSEYDFGDIKQGEKVSHIFILTNTGGDLLKIEKIIPSCGCTAAMPEKSELTPAESTNLTVTFNSAGKRGKQTKIVRINTNDKENPQTLITIRGNVIVVPTDNKKKTDKEGSSAIIHFPETEHDFGVVKEGKTVAYTFEFDNSGNEVLRIGDIKTTCGCTAALVSKKELAPGESGTLNVKLNTANRKGKMSRLITVSSNDPVDPQKVLTVFADIR